MAFKLHPPFKKHSPIYIRDLEEGVMGKGNKNGTILVDKDVDPDNMQKVVDHEEVHIDQVKSCHEFYLTLFIAKIPTTLDLTSF